MREANGREGGEIDASVVFAIRAVPEKKKKNACGLSVSRSCRLEIRVVRASPRLNGGIARAAATRSSPDARLSERNLEERVSNASGDSNALVSPRRASEGARECRILGSPLDRPFGVEKMENPASVVRHVAGTHFFVSAHPVSSSSSGSVSRETRRSYCSFAVTGRSSYRSSSSRLRGASVGSLAVSRKCLASIPHSLSVTSLPGPLSPSSCGSRTSYRGSDRRLERNEPAGRASYRGMEPAAAPRALSCVRDEKTSKKKSTA